MKRTYVILGVIVVFILIVGALKVRDKNIEIKESMQKVSAKTQDVANKQLKIRTKEEVLTISDYDVVIGSPEAKITIFEYLSYSCSHCADFARKTYPILKQEYIDTGLVNFVMRDFPLDEPSLRAAQLTRCVAKDKYEALHKALLENRASWAFAKNFPEKLENIAKLSGLTGEGYHKCMENKDIEAYILTGRIEASKNLGVMSTPTLIIAGQKHQGDTSFESVKQTIDELLAK